MPQSLANFDSALKDFYGPGLKEAVNNSNPVLTEATTNTEDVVGRQAVWSVHTSRSASTGARAELGTLPTADRQRYSQPKAALAYLYHTIKVSGPSKALTRNDSGSFARALEAELDGAEKDLKADLARQVFGRFVTVNSIASTGVLATLTAVATPVVTSTTTSPAEFRAFFVGERIDFIVTATGASRANTPAGGYTISAVNPTAQTVTFSTALDGSVVTGDQMVRFGNFNAEIYGLRALISPTSVFAGIDPAVVPAWASNTVGSASTQISETILDQAAEIVETDGDGSSPSLYIAEQTQRRKLAQQLQAQKMYEGRETTLTAGWRGLQIARGTLLVDRFCPTNTAFAITPKYLVKFVGLDWQWDDDDGKVLYKALDGSDAVEARFKTYMNLVVTVRNAHSVITLSTPTF